MPRPSACRISVAAAICTATEMRCMTKGTNLRVAHVASRSNSACVTVSPVGALLSAHRGLADQLIRALAQPPPHLNQLGC